jgi:hypothetical protein
MMSKKDSNDKYVFRILTCSAVGVAERRLKRERTRVAGQMSEFFFIFNFADTSKWRYRATGLNAVADVVEDAHLVE